MKNKKQIALILSIVVVACVIMAIVDGIIQPGYAIKSGIKILLFFTLPVIYSLFDREIDLKALFRPRKKGFKSAFYLCIPLYIIIVGGYLLLRGVFDFSAITGALADGVGVTGKNFVFVSIYISFINSLLEEFFFRGFAFLSLKRLTGRGFAYVFPSLSFALYHVAMMIGWFSLPLFVLMLAGLFVGGMIFNYLNEKCENVYTSWLVHMFANLGINTVGFILFGII